MMVLGRSGRSSGLNEIDPKRLNAIVLRASSPLYWMPPLDMTGISNPDPSALNARCYWRSKSYKRVAFSLLDLTYIFWFDVKITKQLCRCPNDLLGLRPLSEPTSTICKIHDAGTWQ
jgi:hypothetical protein